MISDLTLQEGGAPVIRELEPKPVEIPAESGHWYDSKTGKQVEFPPHTRIQKIIDAGCVPGVTSIQKMAYRFGLERYKINRAILASRDLVSDDFPGENEGGWIPMSDEMLIEGVWDCLGREGQEITSDGSALHKAIEQDFRCEPYDKRWVVHIAALQHELMRNGIDRTKGKPEHSFATQRYGGKIDYHDDEWLLDFKSKKDTLYVDGKLQKLSWPEHWQQLTAYNMGPPKLRNRRLANVFIGINDAAVKLVELTPKQIRQGWNEFQCLCDFWWVRHNKKQYE